MRCFFYFIETTQSTNRDQNSPSPSSSNENPYETIDNVTVSLETSQSTSSATTSPIYSNVQREAPRSIDNENTELNSASNGENDVSQNESEAVVTRMGSVSSQESTTDENQPLM